MINKPKSSKSSQTPLPSMIHRATEPASDLNDSGSAYMTYLQAKCHIKKSNFKAAMKFLNTLYREDTHVS